MAEQLRLDPLVIRIEEISLAEDREREKSMFPEQKIARNVIYSQVTGNIQDAAEKAELEEMIPVERRCVICHF
jgi:hypothetical protein